MTLSFRSALLLLAAALLLTAAPSCRTAPGGKAGIGAYEVLVKRGDGYYYNSRFEEAAVEYSRAVERSPRRPEAYTYRAYTYMALGKSDLAQRNFDMALKLAADFTEAYLGRGLLHFRLGRYAEAVDDFDEVTGLDPWNAAAHYYKAQACEKIGRLREAVEAYKGYIHCTVPREGSLTGAAIRRIEAIEGRPLR